MRSPAWILLLACLTPSCKGSETPDTDTVPAAEAGEDVSTAASALAPGPGEVCVKLQRGVSVVADAHIAANAPAANYGASTTLAAGGLLVAKSLIRFDMSTIPPNATITRGFLRVSQAVYGGLGGVSAHLVTSSWDEATVTHASFAGAYVPAGFATGVPGGGGPMPPLYFDIQGPLAAWSSGAEPNYGVLLAMGASGNYVFRSSEDTTPPARPTIELCYLDACDPGCQNLGNGRCESSVACTGGSGQGPAPQIAACGPAASYDAAISGAACGAGYHTCTAADLLAQPLAPTPDCSPWGTAWVSYTDANPTYYRSPVDSLVCGGASPVFANLQGTADCTPSGVYPEGWRLIASETYWSSSSHDTSIGCVPHVHHACAYGAGVVPAANTYTLCCHN